jgi:CBS domain-containing protein
MKHEPEDEASAAPLTPHPIRERCVHGPNARERLSLNVFCELRECAINVEHCGRCEHFARIDREGAGFVMRCRPPSVGAGFAHVPVSRALTHRVRCLRRDALCADACTYLRRHGLTRAPVVDERGVFHGTVKIDHLEDAESDHAVDAYLCMDIPAIAEYEPLARAAARLVRGQLEGLPVVDDRGRLVGMLRPLDVVSWWAREQGVAIADDEPR